MTPEERQLLDEVLYRLRRLDRSDRYLFEKHIATRSDIKIGFFGLEPVSQQAAVSSPTGGATIDGSARAAINSLISRLQAYGLLP